MRHTNKSYRLGLHPHSNSSVHSTSVLWKYRWAARLSSGTSRASGLNSITPHIKRKQAVLKTRGFALKNKKKRLQEMSE